MGWPTVLTDLRTLLSDGATDKLNYRKTVFGQADGTNKTFKTFEFRRITDLTSAVAPLGVYVNGTLATVDTDNLVVGEFAVHTAPANTATIEATYYSQWFLDSEIQGFINQGVAWIQAGGNADIIPQGLQPAVLKYAAADAYQDLASKWAMNYSSQYRVEDANDPNKRTPMSAWLQLANNYRKEATELRDQFYRRSGKALQPLFASLTGAVTDPMPQQ